MIGSFRCACAALSLVLGAACGDDGGALPEDWAPAFEAADGGWLLNAWGTGPDDLYATGGDPERGGLVMHFDGAGWAPLPLGLELPVLSWAHGFSPTDITFVGFEGTVVHWDGAQATVQETPTDADLWGVWGAAPDDLWAVGGSGRPDTEPVLLHFDGSAWSAAEVPELERTNVFAFFKVWGTSADNVYVVGQRGAVLRYDGSVWTEELVGASDDLISLWGTGPDEIVAVGGRGIGIASIWDGERWTTHTLEPTPGLNGVWMDEPGVAHAVGTLGTAITLDLETLEVEDESPPIEHCLHGVFGAGDRLLAVGGNLLVQSPPFLGVALERALERTGK